MPKRPISDLDSGDSYCLQSKIHIGNREINQGICAASNMKAVYRNSYLFVILPLLLKCRLTLVLLFMILERTLNLLFQGSKAKANNQPVISSTNLLPTAHLPKYSQTILTSDGQISSQPDNQHITLPAFPLPCKCSSCSSEGSIVLERCKFCERSFCDSCFRPCNVCSGEYCNKCSIQM